MAGGREAGPKSRRRRKEIEFYLVVDGEPDPDVLASNYLWCLRQRELLRQRQMDQDEGNG